MSDLSKITFKKPVGKGLSDMEYRQALDDFIYKFDCITGWERKEEIADMSVLSYSCIRTSSQPESSEYIKDLIGGIKSSNNVTINGTEFSGEIVMVFGSSDGE